MAFPDYEESAAGGDIVELFLFRYGSEPGEYLAYTNHVEALTVATITYEPVPITREDIESSGTLDKTTLRITTDIGTELAELFRVYPPASVVTLVIAQGHVGDPDEEFLAVWAGRIVSASRDGVRLVMGGEPVSTSMRRPGLRRNYQLGCMHALYGPQCQANKAAATVASTVDAINGASVTLDAGWEGAFPPEKFLGGLLEWLAPTGSTESRTILRVTGDVLYLSGLPNNLTVADPVDVVLGCNHKPFAEDGGDCQPLHDNILNYGGCYWIPLKNPIGTYSNYY
jgi:hypothetical protein